MEICPERRLSLIRDGRPRAPLTDLPIDSLRPGLQSAPKDIWIERGAAGTGSCLDGKGDRAADSVMIVRGCYRFSQTKTHIGVGECSFSVYQAAADGEREASDRRALRNFRGYCTSQSRGWWGVWSNAGSSAQSNRATGLVGGGVFQLRNAGTAAHNKPTRRKYL